MYPSIAFSTDQLPDNENRYKRNCSDPLPENWRLAGKAKLSAMQNQVVTGVQYRNLAELSCSREGGSEQLRYKLDFIRNAGFGTSALW